MTELNYLEREIVAELRIIRFLLNKADAQGTTHGEKHFIIQTVMHITHDIENSISHNMGLLERHGEPNLNPDDLPF